MNRILLINDCRFESMIMKDMLNDLGYDVYTSDEYSVVSKIKEMSPDILICNLIMKETRGDELIKRVKRIYGNIKCYISSSNDIKFEAYESCYMDGIIKTPTNTEQLVKILGTTDIERGDNSNSSTGVFRKDTGEELFKRLKLKERVVSKKETKDTLNENIKSKSFKLLKYCPYCGEDVEKFNNSIAFCPFCGGKLN